jgi:peptidoglycan/xylan/chitin deacetylase (PgdA/CDA1 family)
MVVPVKRVAVVGGLVLAAVGLNLVAALGVSPGGAEQVAQAAPVIPPVQAASAPAEDSPAASLADGRPVAAKNPPAKGPARLVSRIETSKKVVFLTLDDGLVTDPKLIRFLAKRQIPVTTFLTTGTVGDAWSYWREMLDLGSIQNHTVNHAALTTRGLAGATSDICGANKAIVSKTGTQPWMVRPPYGRHDSATLSAAGRCGLDYVVMWSVSLPVKHLRYQVGDSLRPGDIILSHYRTDLIPSLKKALRDIKRQGYTVARLEDYLKPKSA